MPASASEAAAPAVTRRVRRLDLVILTDLRFAGGTTSSLIEEVIAASDGGYEIGVLHLASPRLGPTAAVSPRVQQLFDDGVAHLLLPGEHVAARLAIVKHPMVLAVSSGGRLSIDVDRVVVTVGQVPADENGTYYLPRTVDDHILEALGHRAVWIPVSPVVRDRLDGVSVAEATWHEIIAVPAHPRVDPVPTVSIDDAPDPVSISGEAAEATPADPRLVIGRHSRPDRLKWPSDPDELEAAYPVDGSVRVRILGGADPVADVLGAVPDEWEVLEFGSMEPAEFLAGLDAFVYFHHPDLTEAFGRTILEALSAGVLAVVPPHFETTFGSACVYATPATAIDLIHELRADPDRLGAHIDEARRIVAERFSHHTHLERLEALCGPPAGIDTLRAGPVPPVLADIPVGQRRSYTTSLVAAIGLDGEGIEALLRSLERHRRHAPGFVPIVAITTRRPRLADTLGIETNVITGRRGFTGPPGAWPNYVRRRLRQIAAHHDVDNIVVADPHHDDAWIALQLHRVRPAER